MEAGIETPSSWCDDLSVPMESCRGLGNRSAHRLTGEGQPAVNAPPLCNGEADCLQSADDDVYNTLLSVESTTPYQTSTGKTPLLSNVCASASCLGISDCGRSAAALIRPEMERTTIKAG